jgi:hypothetical protein
MTKSGRRADGPDPAAPNSDRLDTRTAKPKSHRAIKARPFAEKNGKVPFNASGVEQVGPSTFIFIDNNDPAALFECTVDADGRQSEPIRRRPLAGVPKDALSDPEGLARVDVNGTTYLIVSSSLCVRRRRRSKELEVNDGLLRVRYTPGGDLHAEAMPGFRSWLLTHLPALETAAGLEPDSEGINFEGVAWDPGRSMLVFGIRSPVPARRFTIVQVPLKSVEGPWDTTVLEPATDLHVEVPDPAAAQGVRDIAYDPDTGDFLIVLGRSISRVNAPYQLCRWDGTAATAALLDPIFHRSMKPEGVTIFSRDGEKKILIVDDGGGFALLDASAAGQRRDR